MHILPTNGLALCVTKSSAVALGRIQIALVAWGTFNRGAHKVKTIRHLTPNVTFCVLTPVRASGVSFPARSVSRTVQCC